LRGAQGIAALVGGMVGACEVSETGTMVIKPLPTLQGGGGEGGGEPFAFTADNYEINSSFAADVGGGGRGGEGGGPSLYDSALSCATILAEEVLTQTPPPPPPAAPAAAPAARVGTGGRGMDGGAHADGRCIPPHVGGERPERKFDVMYTPIWADFDGFDLVQVQDLSNAFRYAKLNPNPETWCKY
jgi:hypothetical protein